VPGCFRSSASRN